jgi:electron transfer flavoprotein alpha subunit
MPGTAWAVAELGSDGFPTRLTLEAAAAARALAIAAGDPSAAMVVVVAPDPGPAALVLAEHAPRVVAVPTAGGAPATTDAVAGVVAAMVGDEGVPDVILLGATPDGRTVAGVLAARLQLGVLGNAVALAWSPGDDGAGPGPRVEMSVLGGRTITTSAFSGGRGIVTVRPGAATGAPQGSTGTVETREPASPPDPRVRVVARTAAAGRSASIEEAAIVVCGGRGLGGPDGVVLLASLAEALGGTVAATRAAVDAGWLPYDVQVGQTGKTVRPAVYVAVGVSGAIQHRVGMQSAETIVAVNRDPDAPLAEHADLYVVGDLFEVVPALVAALRDRGA